ncbi:DUF2490 domain-containing protein [Erythrobacter dokdonensis]|uniref:DUF2490 domain-containing protein n=1 Tax=Erythrobacter dokdonensis TaxID=328225 RepID=UPI00083B5706|nr:DUF2490 domain-containing protein [Erythrobacter dokdonensis]
MTRLSVSSALLLAALVAAWQPSKALAAEEDTQFWLMTFATGEVADGTTLTVDGSQRWRSDGRGGDQQTLRFNIDRQLAKGLRVGGGMMVLDAGGLTELRPHQQITLTRGRFESRTRLEERFFDGADRMELRLRQRILYTQPIARGWRATLNGEWFALLQGRNSGQGASTEQWRAQIAVVHRLDKRLEVGAGYWLVVFPRGERSDRISHVPLTTITWHF